ncbi:UNVERIFIED_CONTAM: Retrovirus-related Pol polyprotein from transposon TNT 1-94 [Sesamum calycinum]|uniref:Retrovirus-related Pol polyprotein from transposon TNT 1-94 n=1 Tax=Sesamum calycinum TaxID=2727403 RepID=A0AAW2KV98_9LAMI
MSNDARTLSDGDIEPESESSVRKVQSLREIYDSCDVASFANLPDGKNVIGVKWIYKTKYIEDGSIQNHKACLGYSQQLGVDFIETFAPVATMKTILFVLAISTQLGLSFYQLDVKLAFLNGELEEEMYVEQPTGCIVQAKEEKVYRLKKALYGLKQVPRAWNSKIDGYFKSNEFERSQNEPSLYVKKVNEKLQLNVGASKVDPKIYGNLVGSLIYLTDTRPDIVYPVSLVSRFMNEPSKLHFTATKRILHYLQGMRKLGINFLIGGTAMKRPCSRSSWRKCVSSCKTGSWTLEINWSIVVADRGDLALAFGVLGQQRLPVIVVGDRKRGREFGLSFKVHHAIVGPSPPSSSKAPSPRHHNHIILTLMIGSRGSRRGWSRWLSPGPLLYCPNGFVEFVVETRARARARSSFLRARARAQTIRARRARARARALKIIIELELEPTKNGRARLELDSLPALHITMKAVPKSV